MRITGLNHFYLRAIRCTRLNSTISRAAPKYDDDGIPTHPAWSVHDLLSSYPQPMISPRTLTRLHELSALIPPTEGTAAHAKLTREMEGLVRLVEAVKLVDTSAVQDRTSAQGVPDGKIWAEGEGIDLSMSGERDDASEGASGRALFTHSARVKDGLYIVDADKSK
ncbi:hypothetical protein WOLCODRAFT_162991 [Wolfiporia cocos MD-104 SS10]|uniref:Uncharacterized protein n=1 Tax=Wolfiporia cocos (strain MD-104) TaxID=742152 RepID=A0A2H3JGL3_WOLCO|nr:hypothetical protein WOLCODRAFT_162991 [Wolfiporia cocos MD-104 SS10]